jgi:hypothetical protein
MVKTMSEQKKYKVTMSIEGEGKFENDETIDKKVFADDKFSSITEAMKLVRTENPEINHMKIWAWSTHEIS